MFEVLVVTTQAELEQWKNQWQAAFQNDPSMDVSAAYFFIAHEWLQLMQPNAELLVVHRGGQLCCAGLVNKNQHKLFGPLRLNSVNLGGLFVTDLLLTGDNQGKAFLALVAHFQRAQQRCHFVNIERATEGFFAQVSNALIGSKLPTLTTESSRVASFDVTANNFAAYFASLGKKSQGSLNYSERLLWREQNQVRFEVIKPSSNAENQLYYERFLALEDQGWKGTESGSIRRRNGSLKYHNDVARDAQEYQNIRWYCLAVDQVTIAMLFVFVRGGTLWVHKTAYDEQYSRYSPGAILLTELLKQAHAAPETSEVNMVTGYAWLKKWQPDYRPYHTVRIFSTGLTARLLIALFKFKDKTWKNLPTG